MARAEGIQSAGPRRSDEGDRRIARGNAAGDAVSAVAGVSGQRGSAIAINA